MGSEEKRKIEPLNIEDCCKARGHGGHFEKQRGAPQIDQERGEAEDLAERTIDGP
jgi:hypothetical protein